MLTMEWKIGEVKQVNGEWYQCVVAMQGCRECSFRTQDFCTRHSECMSTERSDKTSVVFKKLEKIGEPYVGNNGTFQSYKLAMPIYGDIPDQITGFTTTEVVIKQNEEDMEENKLNLKPFDIQKAREGKPVCTRDGRKARIICFDAKGKQPIIALFEGEKADEEIIQTYSINGGYYGFRKEDHRDLMMLPEKKEGWVNVYDDTPIYDTKEEALNKRSEFRGYIDTVKVSWEE